ncbi:MAG: hypothetical protein HC897_16265 [Thermoanaerobaculia bacterium]|nr:hypothetical protein [Thermoanaerobaculia bacterium]
MAPLEITLAYQETESLVKTAVEHGLAEVKTDGLLQDLRKRAGETSLHVGEDLGDTTFEIHVTTYRKNGQELGPIENEIRLRAPAILHAMFPDVEELKGMVEIAQRFQELRASMQKSKPTEDASNDSP